MRASLKIVGFAGLVLVLAACGGSVGGGGSGADQALTDAKCSGSSCAPEAPAAATPDATLPAAMPTSTPPGQPLVCGGLTAAKCPQGYHCVDDPADKCDPATMAADCSGICVLGEELPHAVVGSRVRLAPPATSAQMIPPTRVPAVLPRTVPVSAGPKQKGRAPPTQIARK